MILLSLFSDCSRFWVCEPDLSACLFECAKASATEALYFDVRYQYPVGPVCDWPSEIDCYMPDECLVDEDCLDNEYCDDGKCLEGCRNNAACGTCGECIDHECTEPECCLDSDCQASFLNFLLNKAFFICKHSKHNAKI